MWHDRVQQFLKEFDFDTDRDWRETEDLKAAIAIHRDERPGEGLTRTLFERVLSWKLRSQRQRVAAHLDKLTDQLVEELTGTAFRVRHPEQSVLDRVRVEVLIALPGVGLGVASALLTLYYPNQYGIIDFRAWDEVNERDPSQAPITRVFTVGHLFEYLTKIRAYSAKHAIPTQKVDFALWKVWELRRSGVG